MKKVTTAMLFLIMLIVFAVDSSAEIKREKQEEALSEQQRIEDEAEYIAELKAIYPRNEVLKKGYSKNIGIADIRAPHINYISKKNEMLYSYMGEKINSSKVKMLMNWVENFNSQEIYYTPIRYGDVLPNSYEWVTVEENVVTSVDQILPNSIYEVVVQNQLEEDGLVDTISIKLYNTEGANIDLPKEQ